jgi:hypothetical protein
MPPRLPGLMLLCLSVALPGLIADPVSFPGWGEASIGAMFRNDAFGPGPVSEWDDLDTYGLDFSSPLAGPLRIDAGFDSLTWRGATMTESTRIDTLRLLIGGKLLRDSFAGFHLDATAQGGIEVAGDLSGRSLQEGVHGNLGIVRPVPQTYDSFGAIAPAAALSAQLGWEREIWRIALLASVEGELGIGARCGAGLRFSAGSEESGLSVTLRTLYDPVRGISPTLDQVSARQNGAIVGFACAAGHLRTSLERNISQGVASGGYGVQFDLGPTSPAALPVAVEVSCNLSSLSPGQRVYMAVRDPRIRWYASQAGGWWTPPGAGGATCLRFSDYGAGVEGRLLAPVGTLEIEAAVAAGPFLTAVTEQPACASRSSIVGTGWIAGLRLEPALRIGVLERSVGKRTMKSGAGMAVSLDASLFRSAATSGQAGIVKVFVFSETR